MTSNKTGHFYAPPPLPKLWSGQQAAQTLNVGEHEKWCYQQAALPLCLSANERWMRVTTEDYMERGKEIRPWWHAQLQRTRTPVGLLLQRPAQRYFKLNFTLGVSCVVLLLSPLCLTGCVLKAGRKSPAVRLFFLIERLSNKAPHLPFC